MSLQEHRLNEQIKAPIIRLIDSQGETQGVVKRNEALILAEEEQLDLVEIQPNAEPPVCRIMDYGKFKYEMQKKAQAAKRTQKQSETKEIQFRPVTDDHDYQTKVNHVRNFLKDGHKVRLVIKMRGRERSNFELGQTMAVRLRQDLCDVALFDDKPGRSQDGQILILAQPPKPGQNVGKANDKTNDKTNDKISDKVSETVDTANTTSTAVKMK